MEPVNYNTPSDSFRLPTDRAMWKIILLSMVTFGIYGIIVYSKMSNEINIVATPHDGKHTMHYCLVLFLLGPVTCGIFSIIWIHGLCARIENELRLRGNEYSFGPSDFWLWCVLGSLIIVGPFIFTHKLCKAFNTMNEHFNSFGNDVNGRFAAPATVNEAQDNNSYNDASYDDNNEADHQGYSENETVSFSKSGHIVGQKGSWAGYEIEIKPGEEVIIGKDPSLASIVVDPSCRETSRKHVGISYDSDSGSYIITDYSTNGTWVNGTKIPHNRPVSYGGGAVIECAHQNAVFKLV